MASPLVTTMTTALKTVTGVLPIASWLRLLEWSLILLILAGDGYLSWHLCNLKNEAAQAETNHALLVQLQNQVTMKEAAQARNAETDKKVTDGLATIAALADQNRELEEKENAKPAYTACKLPDTGLLLTNERIARSNALRGARSLVAPGVQ